MTAEVPESFPPLTVDEVRARLVGGDILIVDTRPPFDFAGGRIPGSINLPGVSLKARASEVPPGRGLVIVAADDGRAAEACRLARALGRIVAGYLAGGFDAWTEAGQPAETISDGVGLPTAPDAAAPGGGAAGS